METITEMLDGYRNRIAELLDIPYDGHGPLEIDWDKATERYAQGSFFVDLQPALEIYPLAKYVAEVARVFGPSVEVDRDKIIQAWANDVPPSRAIGA